MFINQYDQVTCEKNIYFLQKCELIFNLSNSLFKNQKGVIKKSNEIKKIMNVVGIYDPVLNVYFCLIIWYLIYFNNACCNATKYETSNDLLFLFVCVWSLITFYDSAIYWMNVSAVFHVLFELL